MKKIIEIIIWPILYAITQFTVALIFSLFFNSSLKLSSSELATYMETTEYQDKLTLFLNNNKIFIVLICCAIFIPIFINMYKKYKGNYQDKLNKNNTIKFIIIGLLYSLVFNTLFYIIGNYTNVIENNYSVLNTMELITLIISTVVLGPILEEYLFRGVMYNKIKEYKFNNPYLLTSLVFTITHMDILSMIYAFIISYILLHFYDKYKTIKAPLIIHVSANLMTLFLPYLFRLNIIYIIGIFIISTPVLIFYLKGEYKTK